MKIISKLYFNLFDKAGTLRLVFVLGCLCAAIRLNAWIDTHKPEPYDFLWVIFWFYFPAIIAFVLKFIRDGYKQDKRSKK